MSSSVARRKTPQRGRLSDVTNTTYLDLSKHRDDDHAIKGCETPLHKEVAKLRKALEEKEELFEAQKAKMDKVWANYNRKTKQNEELVHQNGSLYKDLMQARDKLKVLQHENAQMAFAHKAIKSELQAKLVKALEHVDLSQKVAQLPICEKGLCDEQTRMPNLFARLAESRARRTVGEASTKLSDVVKYETSEYLAICQSTLRPRGSFSYKEPSLKAKLRQPECVSQVKPHREERNQHLKIVCEETTAIPEMRCTTEDAVSEYSLPQPIQSVEQTHCLSSVVRAAAGQNKGRSEACIQANNRVSRDDLESSLCQRESSSGRPSRRSSVGTISSYKEAALNTKLRQSS